MILDTSAVVAVARGEAEASQVAEAVAGAESLAISAATLVELHAVVARTGSDRLARLVATLLEQWQPEVAAFDADHAKLASRAYRIFGRGSGHAAALNLGDTFSYALAIARDEPLLYVGDGFARTDVAAALTS